MRSALLALILALVPANAADPNQPHPHQGALRPYPSPPPPIRLSEGEEVAFQSGRPVFTLTDGGSTGRGAAVFLVKAPPEKVWKVLRSFGSYPKWVDGVSACEVYRTEGNHIYVRFLVEKMGVSVEYFVKHNFPRGAEWGTWTLDYSRQSDLDDSVGMWRVTPLPNDPTRSRVEYSVDLKVSGWVPSFIRGLLVDEGLESATLWVKEQSEKP